jgi:hypothetical protein
LYKTRLKRLPVISREHFRKTRTNYFLNTYWVSQTPICKMVSQLLALKKAIGMSNNNWYVDIPIDTQIVFEVMSAT